MKIDGTAVNSCQINLVKPVDQFVIERKLRSYVVSRKIGAGPFGGFLY